MQILDNKKLNCNKILLFFVIQDFQFLDSDPYFKLRPKSLNKLLLLAQNESNVFTLVTNKSELIFHLDHLTKVCHLYIFLSIALNMLVIAYSKNYLSFSCSYEIIFRSWYISGLTKFLCFFI